MYENNESSCRIKLKKKKVLSAPLILTYDDNNFSYYIDF